MTVVLVIGTTAHAPGCRKKAGQDVIRTAKPSSSLRGKDGVTDLQRRQSAYSVSLFDRERSRKAPSLRANESETSKPGNI
jgi:hypothetical protein